MFKNSAIFLFILKKVLIFMFKNSTPDNFSPATHHLIKRARGAKIMPNLIKGGPMFPVLYIPVLYIWYAGNLVTIDALPRGPLTLLITRYITIKQGEYIGNKLKVNLKENIQQILNIGSY